MRVRDYVEEMLWEIIYLIVTVVYLIKLNALNQELLLCNFTDAFKLLQYKEYAPLKYFGIATCLFFGGCFLIWREIHHIRLELDSFEEIIISCLGIFVIAILLLLLIVFINNPILRAVFVAGLVILGLMNGK